mmetsp:Transcript_7014/g.10047  ORF Transcript_7014/g.10047 Transcript_7014/m.10047 type:complete len:121 (-) Transcript_7014:7-369(-)
MVPLAPWAFSVLFTGHMRQLPKFFVSSCLILTSRARATICPALVQSSGPYRRVTPATVVDQHGIMTCDFQTDVFGDEVGAATIHVHRPSPVLDGGQDLLVSLFFKLKWNISPSVRFQREK